jgi:hypothetical protein
VGDPIARNEKAGNFEKEDEEERSDVFFLCPKLIRAKDEPAKDSHEAACENEKTEEFKEKIEKGPNGARLEFMSESEKRKIFAEFNEVPRGEPLDHIHNKSGHEAEDKKCMG